MNLVIARRPGRHLGVSASTAPRPQLRRVRSAITGPEPVMRRGSRMDRILRDQWTIKPAI
jgi:hypothetical protein